MKKNILYILASIAVIFTSCDPLEDAVNELKPVAESRTLALTLATADYALLPDNNYAQKGGYFLTVDDANTSIALILNSKYPQLGNGAKANVIYNAISASIKPADSLLASTGNVPTQYTVTDEDYAATNGNAFKNFSAAKVVEFLNTKYPTKAENQLVVLNYTFYQGGVTTSAGAPVVETFLYRNGAWIKPYHVSQAQYISAGKLTVFNFAAADEANLNGYFNTFLKSDAAVSATAKAGDVKYISFTYFASNKNYQRIRALSFDGTNWVSKSIPSASLAFLKKGGTWIPDPTVYYTLSRADYNTIGASTIGTAAARTNLTSFGSFDVSGGPNNWKDSEINEGLILILNAKYPNAPVDETVLYKLTCALYRGSKPTVTKSFAKTTTGFVFVPEPQ